MIFGFLFLDILFWGFVPLLLLLLLWSDKKAWAGSVTVIAIVAMAMMGSIPVHLTDPVWIGEVIKNVLIYAGIGLGFSFLKWKVLASKTARAFAQYVEGKSFRTVEAINADPKIDPSDRASEFLGERNRAADYFNAYTNPYKRVLLVVAKDGGGWKTSYNKWVLGQYVSSWVVYWPFYLVLLVLDDLIRHLVDWFVEVFGRGYQKLADASFAKID